MVVLMVVAAFVTTGDVLIVGIGIGGLAIGILSAACFWIAAGYEQRAPWTVKDARAEPMREDDRPSRPVKTLVVLTAVLLFYAEYCDRPRERWPSQRAAVP
jgi:hypothetical protein